MRNPRRPHTVPHMRIPLVCLGALAALTVTPAAAGAASGNPDIQGPALSRALTDLGNQLKALSALDGSAGRSGRSLATRRTKVTAALKRNQTCDAASALGALRKVARGASAAPDDLRAAVLASSLNAEVILRSRSSTTGCGHAQRSPARVGFGRAIASDTDGVSMRLQFPTLKFAPTTGGGRALVTPVPEGMAATATGMPEIPWLTRLVAIPEGATLSASVKGVSSYVLDGVDVASKQPDPNAQAPDGSLPQYPGSDSPLFATPAYQPNTATLNSAQAYPRRTLAIKSLGTWHGLRIAAVSVPAAQYVGRSRKLRVITASDVNVRFVGGSSTFGSRAAVASGIDELKALAPVVVNLKTAVDALKAVPVKACGSKLVIVTTPELRVAADELAQLKRTAGLSTLVVNVGSGPGDAGSTAPEIATFLRKLRSSDCGQLPRDVILYGKAIPTFIRKSQRKNAGEPDHATDYPYSLLAPNLDTFPVVGLGRLPAKDLDEARTINGKIATWMDHGPADPSFYKRTLVAGLFQVNAGNKVRESQSFIQSLESARATMMTSFRQVDRAYDADAGTTPCSSRTAP